MGFHCIELGSTVGKETQNNDKNPCYKGTNKHDEELNTQLGAVTTIGSSLRLDAPLIERILMNHRPSIKIPQLSESIQTYF